MGKEKGRRFEEVGGEQDGRDSWTFLDGGAVVVLPPPPAPCDNSTGSKRSNNKNEIETMNKLKLIE